MTPQIGTRRDPVLIGLISGLVLFAGAFVGVACTEPAVNSAPPAPPKVSFAECQKSAEYPGGRYAVEYDAGVCTVQR